eukprot:gene8518-4205_t
MTAKARVTRILEKYEPAQLPKVDAFLAGSAGREERLIAGLVRRHGSEQLPGDAAGA